MERPITSAGYFEWLAVGCVKGKKKKKKNKKKKKTRPQPPATEVLTDLGWWNGWILGTINFD